MTNKSGPGGRAPVARRAWRRRSSASSSARGFPLPWWRKARFTAAAGVPAVLYGVSQTHLPMPALRRLRNLFCRALIRAPRRVAPEALSCLLGPLWRGDVAAYPVVAPWRALLRRWVPGPAAAGGAARPGRAVGPFAAARAALQVAEAVVSADGAWTAGGVGPMEDPPSQPAAVVEGWLHMAWQAAEWGRLVARRPSFAGVRMPDAWATGCEIRRARPPTVAGALRMVLVGAAVPQSVAVGWTGISAYPDDARCLRHRF